MRRFFIDQLLFLAVGIVFMILIPTFCGNISTYVFEGIVLLTWCYQCRRVIIIPFDYLLGKTVQIVCFSNECSIHKYEFFKNNYCCEWKFYFAGDKTLVLLFPNGFRDKPSKAFSPEKDQRVKITYFKLSKILLNWEPV